MNSRKFVSLQAGVVDIIAGKNEANFGRRLKKNASRTNSGLLPAFFMNLAERNIKGNLILSISFWYYLREAGNCE